MNLWGLWGGGGGGHTRQPPSLRACCTLLVCFSPTILAVRTRALEGRGGEGKGCGCAYKNREHKPRDGRGLRSVKIVVFYS